jgi:GT2 family glycosyltransferase
MSAIGAVVVNYDGGDRVLRCLHALKGQSLALARIVVVDNGSSDGSAEEIARRFPDVELVRLGANRGLPAARNVGLARLATPLALLADADVYLDPDGAERLERARERSGAAVVCPRIVLHPEDDVIQADGATVHFVGTLGLRHGGARLAGASAASELVGASPGGCMLVERATVLEAGGFDESFFFYFEDLEFSLRMRARGHAIACEPAAVARHDRRSGTEGLAFRGRGAYPARRAYLTMRNRLLTVLVHYRARTLAVLAPALLAYEVASLALAVARGAGREWARAWLWQARHAGAIRERRRRAQRLRVRPDRELLAGGPLPLAPGLLRSRVERAAVGALSRALDAYWRLVGGWIG